VANWVMCTKAADNGPIVINLDTAASIAVAKKNGQIQGAVIAFPGSPGDTVWVKETAEDILKRAGIKNA